ncbi:MAG: transketolase [Planctomycetota bacterium]
MPANAEKVLDLEKCAAEVRLQIVRAMGPGKFHHFGGSLSVTDILVALYFYKMRYRPEEPDWPERDRVVLSKGHGVPALYVCLARAGFFPLSELDSLKTLGSSLQGHPDMRKTRGLEANTGSLGMGLSVANGMAMATRIAGLDSRVYAVLGDGECQEGQVWEAAMTAAHYGLGHLTAIVDRNELQAMGGTEHGMSIEPIVSKWDSFGWQTCEIDGHDMAEICDALDDAERATGVPTAIVARTVKGKGVSFMEGLPGFHNVMISEDQFRQAVTELEATIASLGGR